jgi:hypothetical protein
MLDLTFKLVLVTSDASLKPAEVKQEAESAQAAMEKPAAIKITAEQALATIRDVKIAVDGVLHVVGGLAKSMNSLLYQFSLIKLIYAICNLSFSCKVRGRVDKDIERGCQDR